MRLSEHQKLDNFDELKGLIASSVIRLGELVKEPNITQHQKEVINDAIVIGQTLSDADVNQEDFKRSASRFKKLVSAAFTEDVADLGMREEIKQQQTNRVKAVEPRSFGEAVTVGDTYPDTPTVTTGKTASAVDPSLIVERVIRDIGHKFYSTAQDAFDGYCQEGGAYVYASAKQKCDVGKLLRFYGFVIDYDKFEKEAKKDFEEWKKKYKDLGKGERKAQMPLVQHPGEHEQQYPPKPHGATDLIYCPTCAGGSGKTSWHGSSPTDPSKKVCLECGKEKYPAAGGSMAPRPRSGILDKIEAKSDAANEFISKEIKHLIDDKGYSQDQAVAAAHSVAREKGYKVPQKNAAIEIEAEGDWPEHLKKGRFTEYCKKEGFEGPCKECAEKAMNSDDASVRGMASFYTNTVKAQYNPYDQDGMMGQVDQINTKPEMVKKGDMYSCGNCGGMERFGDESEAVCKGCKCRMTRADTSPSLVDRNDDSNPVNQKLLDNNNPKQRQMSDGAQYMAIYQKAADVDDWVGIETVRISHPKVASYMHDIGMARIKASYLLEVLGGTDWQ